MDGLKTEFPQSLKVISVDVQTSLGRTLTREYGKFTPTFILFDPDGEEIWRMIGSLDPDQVRENLPD